MCLFSFNATLKDSSHLAQPLRKVSDSCICLFYIKLSSVLCMFFSVRNGGGRGNLHKTALVLQFVIFLIIIFYRRCETVQGL